MQSAGAALAEDPKSDFASFGLLLLFPSLPLTMDSHPLPNPSLFLHLFSANMQSASTDRIPIHRADIEIHCLKAINRFSVAVSLSSRLIKIRNITKLQEEARTLRRLWAQNLLSRELFSSAFDHTFQEAEDRIIQLLLTKAIKSKLVRRLKAGVKEKTQLDK